MKRSHHGIKSTQTKPPQPPAVSPIVTTLPAPGLLGALYAFPPAAIQPHPIYHTLARYARCPHHGGPNATLIQLLLLDNHQACHPPTFQCGTWGLQRPACVSSNHTRAKGLVFGCLYCVRGMPAPNKNPAPSGQEGSRTIQIATWNTVNGRGGETTTGSRGHEANGDRIGGIDGDKNCQRLIP
jgi:hypothetical protein